jgi:hypothetical protein
VTLALDPALGAASAREKSPASNGQRLQSASPIASSRSQVVTRTARSNLNCDLESDIGHG